MERLNTRAVLELGIPSRGSLINTIVDKFPACDEAWTTEQKSAWFDALFRLLDIIDSHEKPSADEIKGMRER